MPATRAMARIATLAQRPQHQRLGRRDDGRFRGERTNCLPQA
jgi:hypothetical protein